MNSKGNIYIYLEKAKEKKGVNRDFKKYSYSQWCDIILKSVLNDPEYPNLKTFVMVDVLEKQNLYLTQHEIIDLLNDFYDEGLIRTTTQSENDFHFNLTPKTKKIYRHFSTYNEWEIKEKAKESEKLKLDHIRNWIAIIAASISVVIALYNVYEIKPLMHTIQEIKSNQLLLNHKQKLSDALLHNILKNPIDTIVVLSKKPE